MLHTHTPHDEAFLKVNRRRRARQGGTSPVNNGGVPLGETPGTQVLRGRLRPLVLLRERGKCCHYSGVLESQQCNNNR